MRRSSHVIAPLLAASAMTLLTGCRHPRTQELERCVDESNHVVDPSFCKNLPPGAQQPVTGTPQDNSVPYNTTIYFPHTYRYYYGGSGSSIIGSIVSDGSYTPSAGHSYAFSSASGTTRGGFGSSFSSHGSSSRGS
jgi:hypothetical protein